MRIKIADLETPPDRTKGGILLPAPLQLRDRQLRAIPALLRLARAANVAADAGYIEASEDFYPALAAFDFRDEP